MSQKAVITCKVNDKQPIQVFTELDPLRASVDQIILHLVEERLIPIKFQIKKEAPECLYGWVSAEVKIEILGIKWLSE